MLSLKSQRLFIVISITHDLMRNALVVLLIIKINLNDHFVIKKEKKKLLHLEW